MLKTADGKASSINIGNEPSPELDPTPSAVQLCRRFSWVQELQLYERLWLVLERSVVTGGTLNDKTLELVAVAQRHQECEIMSLVKRSNQLVLNIAASRRRQTFPQVAIEVRCRTFLRQPAWKIDETNSKFEITGLLIGVSETPLELYARVGQENVLYAVVHANEPCSFFRYQSEIPVAATDRETPVQIDLVQGGVIWHRVSGPLRSGPEPH